MSDIIAVEHVSRRFGDKLALDDISYHAEEGKVYGLVGANGAGKTTLIKHMLGLLRAHSGSVRLFGQDPVKAPVEVLGQVGYLSEERDLPDWMTIDQMMRYTSAYFPAWDAQYADELLTTFGLDRRNRIKDLSKGMRAQAGLVSAVAHRPGLLILDEPSSGLDALVREDILNAIMRTVSGEGRTVVFSSHLLDEVEEMSDHITMVNAGRVVLDGELDQIRGQHQRSEVRFSSAIPRRSELKEVLSVSHDDETCYLVHDRPLPQIKELLERLGGTLIASRSATLQEIFLARVGRGQESEPDE